MGRRPRARDVADAAPERHDHAGGDIKRPRLQPEEYRTPRKSRDYVRAREPATGSRSLRLASVTAGAQPRPLGTMGSKLVLNCHPRAGTATLPSSVCYEHRAGRCLQRGSRTRPRRCLCQRARERHDSLPSRGIGQAGLVAAVRLSPVTDWIESNIPS